MAVIAKFEDIEAWIEARKLTLEIYRVSRRSPFIRDFGLRDQIQRASVSIMANIAEGFDSGSHREFCRFLGYSLRSASEVQSHLHVALSQEYVSTQDYDMLFRQTIVVKNLIHGFIRYLKS